GYQYAWLSADATLELVVGGHARLPSEPMTASTTLNAYSVAKTLTAAAILELAAQQRLDLDAPLDSLLGFARSFNQKPTVRQTLAHLGGWPNPLPVSWIHLAAEHAAFDRAQFVTRVLNDNPRLEKAPGRAFAYSNLGYLLLGVAIENVTRGRYEDYVEQRLLRPLGLPDGATLSFTIPSSNRHAYGHIRRLGVLDLALGLFLERRKFAGRATGRWVEMQPHYVNGAAYGGLIANAAGLGRYLQALLEPRGWLTPAAHDLLFAPVRTSAGVELRRSLGWFRGTLGRHRYFAHAGGGAAYYCEARLYPELQRASVVMLNRAGLSDARLLDSLDRCLLPAG
ncbi:MAG TPA: serine hydrolase domain-containing protein, partial [Gammaproteobacteria bacterium]|nr:serine hydrolase domain-containing protein [Gammaproteobacteria bacterium]